MSYNKKRDEKKIYCPKCGRKTFDCTIHYKVSGFYSLSRLSRDLSVEEIEYVKFYCDCGYTWIPKQWSI